ncbi:MAG TPA: YgjP-like metallopeptidase domain-containing protein [Candidatus Saccharimonadales bacterium]|jgi:predicted metal-dependent hydrolase|nr:YgjP-like metallopeptidase domain-containing protein [Candidatus Saccharimonadales bacterium]
MAFKRFVLPDGTPVTIYKRKASRGLRLTVTPEGEARVSIPRWTAYAVGLKFAASRTDWIRSQQKPPAYLVDGQRVGKAHRLRFVSRPDVAKIASRVSNTEVIITLPTGQSFKAPAAQEAARRAAIRALRMEAEALLPKRLVALADQYGFTYNKVTVKQMKSRWGSCDSHRNIVLNLFLMQLPWEQIDYVLLHELTHTEVLRHGPDFWQAMEKVLPDVKRLRKAVRGASPLVYDPTRAVA